jgi:hypothetical protein
MAKPGPLDLHDRLVTDRVAVMPGRDVEDVAGPKVTDDPSRKSIPRRPEMMNPTCRISHHSPPTVGRTCFDQRQPGWFTRRPTVRSPRWTMSVRTFGKLTTSSGWSTLFRRTSATGQS